MKYIVEFPACWYLKATPTARGTLIATATGDPVRATRYETEEAAKAGLLAAKAAKHFKPAAIKAAKIVAVGA